VQLIERIWRGVTPADRLARSAFAPLAAIYRGIAGIRGEMYDRGYMASHTSSIPVVSVGNITVGGSGKTPVAAWITSRMLEMGHRPAIVLRGYGGDEPLVHERLNPAAKVIVQPDRVAGIAQAAREGADVAILDDAFQHRRAARDVDIVLVSADAWPARQRMLPAGPFREPPAALKRASVIVVTRKAADDAMVSALESAVKRETPDVPVAVMRLSLSGLCAAGDNGAGNLPIGAIRGKRVAAVAAVGNPDAFFQQLENAGARVTPLAFPDHHPFAPSDVAAILARAESADYVISTLKDAVKLEPLWAPSPSPLWYVSLAVTVERGDAVLDALLMRLHGRRVVK